MDLRETKSLLRRYAIQPKKIYGQNFLISEEIARREVEAANIDESEVVLEIGPGLGALTEHILERGCRVVAIEKDPVFIRVLKDRFPEAPLEIIHGDVLKVELPPFDAVISNIPYVISSPLTFRLFKHGFTRGVLTYQEEFAFRFVAEPEDVDYSRLSVATYYYADAEILETIPPSAFYPSPSVRSALVRLKSKTPPFKVNEEVFFKLIQGMFTVKKKTVKNALSITTKVVGVEVDTGELSPKLLKKRVFELRPDDFASISKLVI